MLDHVATLLKVCLSCLLSCRRFLILQYLHDRIRPFEHLLPQSITNLHCCHLMKRHVKHDLQFSPSPCSAYMHNLHTVLQREKHLLHLWEQQEAALQLALQDL